MPREALKELNKDQLKAKNVILPNADPANPIAGSKDTDGDGMPDVWEKPYPQTPNYATIPINNPDQFPKLGL